MRSAAVSSGCAQKRDRSTGGPGPSGSGTSLEYFSPPYDSLKGNPSGLTRLATRRNPIVIVRSGEAGGPVLVGISVADGTGLPVRRRRCRRRPLLRFFIW
jgi:hypothetical protein